MIMHEFWTFFAFPLNLLLALLWMIGWVWVRRRHPDCQLLRFMMSPAATISSILLLLAACLWIGFTGNREFVYSVPFVIILLYLQTILFLVILRGWRTSSGKIRWRFLLVHVGLLLALGAGFWGSADSSEVRMRIYEGETSHEAYRMDGNSSSLAYELTVLDLMTEMSEDGIPSTFEARIAVDGGDPVCISVNHPYSVRFGENIYLASISDNCCILQIVREPWRHFALAGIIMLLVGAFMLFIKGPKR